MPSPRRTTRKSSSAGKTTPPTSRSPHEDHAHSPKDDLKENQGTPKSIVNKEDKTTTFHIDEAPDPARLDEEIPGQHDEVFTSPRSTYSGGYNALKTFNGQVYTGMAVGGSHTWNYDQGVWKETKAEPDLWKIDYETTKRRAKNAPTGSGAPIGMEYHWLIVAHQYVKKTDANTYETHLVGSKYKLAHKPATSNSWSVPTVKAQREREVELLEDAKRRVQGLPPVLAGEKVKVDKRERGQQKLDSLFTRTAESKGGSPVGVKRKREEDQATDGREVLKAKRQ